MKIFKKIVFFVCSIFFLSVVLFFKRETTNENELIVGVMSGYPPYCQLDDQGNLVGFDCDVAHCIAVNLNKKLVLGDMNLSSLLIALQQNKIDMILSGLSITPERQEAMAMVYYQGTPTMSYPLLFWQKIPDDIRSIEDLQCYPNAIICVEPGSVQEKFLLEFPFLTLRQISNCAEIIMELKYNKACAAVVDPDILSSLTQKSSDIKVVNIQLPKQFQSQGCGIALNKNNVVLLQQVKDSITRMNADGTLKKLEQQWFGEQ